MGIRWKAVLACFLIPTCCDVFSQELKKAREGTFEILQSSSKLPTALAEEVLFEIEAKRKEAENVIMVLPAGISILIYSKDSVESMKLHPVSEEIIPKKKETMQSY